MNMRGLEGSAEGGGDADHGGRVHQKTIHHREEAFAGKAFVTQTHVPSALPHPEQLQEMRMLDGLHLRQARQEVLPVTVVAEGGGFHYQ